MISDNVVQITTSFTNKAKQAEINANEMMMLSWRYTKLTFITGCTGVFWPAASGQRTVTVNSRRCNLTTRSNHTNHILSVYVMVQKTRPNVWTNLRDFSGKLQRRFYLEHNFYLLFNFTTQSDRLAKDNNPVFLLSNNQVNTSLVGQTYSLNTELSPNFVEKNQISKHRILIISVRWYPDNVN